MAQRDADRLVRLAADAELFRDEDEVAYASVPDRGHEETYPILSERFRSWLRSRFYIKFRKAPSQASVENAVRTLEASARHEGSTEPVFIRLAQVGSGIYLDLANSAREVVRITAAGWRVTTTSRVKFIRPKGLAALVVPVAGGSVNLLKRVTNLTQRTFVLLVGYLVSALRPFGPYLVGEVQGEQGAAKTTLMRMSRALTDPNTTPVRAEPRDERDLMIAASKAWLLAFDNLSKLSPWLSDALCRLATGGGFATRQLYTDSSEVLFNVKRPTMVTGIEELAIRGDLLDRTVTLTLEPIPPDERRTEASVWTEFEELQARILGALLDAVSAAIRNLDSVDTRGFSRMADVEQWVTAAEPALGWEPGTFRRAYAKNRERARARLLELNPIVGLIVELVEHGNWEGTAAELYESLNGPARESNVRLPNGSPALGSQLRRLAPLLRESGVQVGWRRRGHRGDRVITLTGVERREGSGSAVSTVSTVRNTVRLGSSRRPGRRGNRTASKTRQSTSRRRR